MPERNQPQLLERKLLPSEAYLEALLKGEIKPPPSLDEAISEGEERLAETEIELRKRLPYGREPTIINI